jgi:hypothetical protein
VLLARSVSLVPLISVVLMTEAAGQKPVHRAEITVVGPVATVTVERQVEGDRRKDAVLDVDLPEGARLLSLELVSDRGRRKLGASAAADARRAYAEALNLTQQEARAEAAEASTDLRVRVGSAGAR